jgi:hypothetical protein
MTGSYTNLALDKALCGATTSAGKQSTLRSAGRQRATALGEP